MTNDEWAARREHIKQVNEDSNNRVKEFIELIARMCAERTASRRTRAPMASSEKSGVVDYGSASLQGCSRARV